jgi:hypothetical protein
MTGRQLKLAGMDLAAENRKQVLEAARTVALHLAANGAHITSDDVKAAMCRDGSGWTDASLSEALGNASGSIFRDGNWQFVRFTESTRDAAHARVLRVWRRK